MNHLINEIKINLEEQNYLSALCLTLILPDICGKIEFPKDNVGNRYRKWYDKYIYQYDIPEYERGNDKSMIINGEIVYRLRCLLFHEGSIDVVEDIRKEKNIKDFQQLKFILTNNFTSYSKVWAGGDKSREPDIAIRIGVEDFCKKIYWVVENLYCEKNTLNDINNDIVIFDFNSYKTSIRRSFCWQKP